MHVLREHNGTKIEIYRTNTISQGLVPPHFALIIGASLSEPHIFETYDLLVPGGHPVNVLRTNVRPAV